MGYSVMQTMPLTGHLQVLIRFGLHDRGQGQQSLILESYMSNPKEQRNLGNLFAKEVAVQQQRTLRMTLFLNRLPYFGGDWNDGGRCGCFLLMWIVPLIIRMRVVARA